MPTSPPPPLLCLLSDMGYLNGFRKYYKSTDGEQSRQKKNTMAAKRNKSLLLYLAEAGLTQLKKVLGILSPDERQALKEIAYNLVNKRIPLAKHALTQLRKYKGYLKELAKKGLENCRRKRTKWCTAIQFMLKTVLDAIKIL